MGILGLREGRRPVRSQAEVAEEQRLESLDAHPVCYQPQRGCPGLGVHPWDLSPHYLGKDSGAGFALLPVPRESHGSQDFLPPSSSSASALCPGPSEVLPSGLAQLSLQLTFRITIPAPLD